MILAVSLVLAYVVYKAYSSRQSIITECNVYSQEIISSVESENIQQNLKEYLSFNPAQTRQRVLKREDNLIMVNFVDHNKALLKAYKIK